MGFLPFNSRSTVVIHRYLAPSPRLPTVPLRSPLLLCSPSVSLLGIVHRDFSHLFTHYPLRPAAALRRSPSVFPAVFQSLLSRAPPRTPSLSLRLPLSRDPTPSSLTMFSLKSIATFALAANLVLGVPTWRRNDIPSLSEWKSKNLEVCPRPPRLLSLPTTTDVHESDVCSPIPSSVS